jgi:hypothetical protein
MLKMLELSKAKTTIPDLESQLTKSEVNLEAVNTGILSKEEELMKAQEDKKHVESAFVEVNDI